MLNQQIRDLVAQFNDELPPELTALIEQGAGEISVMDIQERALKVGAKAPDFSLTDQHGNSHSLASLVANGPLVLTFYRGVWCPYCNLQLAAYNQRIDDITATGAQLVAISPEKPDALETFLASGAPDAAKESVVEEKAFPVLHDAGNALAEKFGVVFTLPTSHQQILEMLQVDIEKVNGDNSFSFPDPATFIIDTDQTIAWTFVPNNYRKRAEASAIIEQLTQLKKETAA